MNKILAMRRHNFVFKESTKFAAVTRDQIVGADSYLVMFDSLIYQLRKFDLLDDAGVKIPSGVCLYGPPGTGKTFFSRYLATESGACFVDMRKFPRPLVEQRTDMLAPDDIIDLFILAKQFIKKHHRPIVLFYDELSEDTDEDIIEQLRMEIDGIAGKSNGILLVLTTTADDPEEIDEGLFRDQRVSLHIPFTPPTPKGREAIFRYYISKVPHDKHIDIAGISSLFDGDTTPASIKQYIEDAYANASMGKRADCKRKKKLILKEQHLVDAIMPHLVGFFTDELLTQDEKKVTAIHEAGHAYLGLTLGLSIQAVSAHRSISGESHFHGLTVAIAPDDKVTTIDDLRKRLIFCYGGMIAEKLCGFADNTGIKGDLGNIDHISHVLVNRLAQGKRLRAKFGTLLLEEKTPYSEEVLRLRDLDAALIIKEAERMAMKLAKPGINKIKKIAARLLEKKIVFQSELKELIK